MIEGTYTAIAKDDLVLQDSPQCWKKGESYIAEVESGGVMHLQSELGTSHYTKEGTEKLSELFEFEKLS